MSVLGFISEDSDYCEGYGMYCTIFDHDFGLTTTLTYDYVPRPAPEPASSWLFLAGLTGFLGITHMRRRAAHIR